MNKQQREIKALAAKGWTYRMIRNLFNQQCRDMEQVEEDIDIVKAEYEDEREERMMKYD